MKKVLIVVVALVAAGCGHKKSVSAPMDMAETAKTPRSDIIYTCSMHPQIMQDHPGKCPICGMDLIAEKKSAAEQEETVTLTDRQMQLGGIRLDTVGASTLTSQMLITGTVTVDESRNTAVSGRLNGRIERLYFKEAGVYIHKGDKLYDLYSEELNNAKQEYLLALDRMDSLKGGLVDLKQLADAARTKLLLWGMTDGQVAELTRTRQTAALSSFFSPVSGYISTIESHEGDYLSAGTVVLRLADLSSVWVEAQVYTSQLPGFDRKAPVTVRFPDLPGKQFASRINLVNPEVDPDHRTGLVRVQLSNPDGLLRPGMQAEVTISGGNAHGLTLPETAVLWSKGGYMVWVLAGHNSFRPVMVETGLEAGYRIEIRSGLKAGDIVVTDGAYLVNSEFTFRHGRNAMAGMKM